MLGFKLGNQLVCLLAVPAAEIDVSWLSSSQQRYGTCSKPCGT